MRDGNWFRQGRGRSKGGKSRGKAKRGRTARDRGRLSFEALEDRRMLATFLVTNLSDLDVNNNVVLGSLRWALGQANAADNADTIVFSDNIFTSIQGTPDSTQAGHIPPRTISLNGGQLNITQPVSILGPGPLQLGIRAQANNRVFNINIGADDELFNVQISGVTITGGSISGTPEDRKGGGVFNRERLTMVETRVIGNSASQGGGGIYNHLGSLRLERSLVYNNSTGTSGGGILNGSGDTRPTATLVHSTITGNRASTGATGYGGGVLNRNGTVSIENSTITTNRAGKGEGVASWGNPLPDEPGGDPPAPTVFTFVYSSILFGNGASDIDRVGKSDDDPPVDLLPSINRDPGDATLFISPGFNIVGTGNATVVGDDQGFEHGKNFDQVGVDPLFVSTPTGTPILKDYGGSTEVYLLQPTSTAIDQGDESFFAFGEFEQRGMHFERVYDFTGTRLDPNTGEPIAVIDIGAVEMQEGVFVVDTLIDDDDRSFSNIFDLEFVAGSPVFTIAPEPYSTPGDFSIREAIEFANKHPGPDVVRFHDRLLSEEALEEEDFNGGVPTIRLTQGMLNPLNAAIKITADVVIEGRTDFILEIDASGNDTQQGVRGGGSSVFVIDDLLLSNQLNVSISNLTLMGGDPVGNGGGILTRENLVLRHMTLKNNQADDGGAIYVAAGSIEVHDSTFNNNVSDDDGGAVFVNTPTGAAASGASFTNSTLSANVSGDRGGAIYNNNGNVSAIFSTITLNDSGGLGSGIANAGANSFTTLAATIVSGNIDDDVHYVTTTGATAGTFNTLGYNLIGLGNGRVSFNKPTDRIDILDPELEPLLNTGGLIQTHRPSSLSSPVVDQGPLATDPVLFLMPLFDQRGEVSIDSFTRFFDADGVGGARADIGAYELQGFTLFVDHLSDENDGDTSAGNLSLREAIELSNDNPLPDRIEFEATLLSDLVNQASGPDPAINLSNNLQPGTEPDIRITDSVTIVGPGADFLAIDGSAFAATFSFDGSRMFTIDDGDSDDEIDVTISGFTFRDARAPEAGGAIFNSENLTLLGVTFVNNQTIDFEELDVPVDLQGLHGAAIFHQNGKLIIDQDADGNESRLLANRTTDLGADGGAIYVQGGEVEIANTSISGNATEQFGDGGAIFIKDGQLKTLGNVTISGNSTLGGIGDGGGFYSDNSTVEFFDATITSNSTVGANSEGGGVAAFNSSITLIDSRVSLNTTQGTQSQGGGIYLSGGSLALTRSTVSQNTTSGGSASGGGISIVGGTATLDATSVDRNQVNAAGGHGGGVSNFGGTLVIKNSTLYDNQAVHGQSNGGGVYSDDLGVSGASDAHSTLIINSTVSGNSAGFRGGGVFNVDGVTDIRYSTITNNSTPFMNAGNGVASHGSSSTLTRFYSSIVAGNAIGTGSDVDNVIGTTFNSIQSLGFNVIGTGNSPTKFTATGDQAGVTNPGLGALTNNGGLTRTHALLAGSPAIDKGSSSAAPGVGDVPLLDQRGPGFTRVYNGDNAGTARIDVGAFELQGPGLAGDFSGDDVVDGTDFLTWQRNVANANPAPANGDLNNDNDVDGADLAGWEASFGAGSENVVAVAAAVAGGEPFVEVAVASTSSVSDAPVVFASSPATSNAATAEDDVQTPAAARVAASFVGLGRPGVRAADGAFAGFAKKADRQVAAAISVLSRDKPSWLAADDADDLGLSSLEDAEASEDGERTEDAVFAAWDAPFSV